jgi:hypothetical protein
MNAWESVVVFANALANNLEYLRHQVGLKLVQVDIQATVEAERRGDGRDDLSNEPIEVGETGRRNAEVPLANIVNCFIIYLTIAKGQKEFSCCSSD